MKINFKWITSIGLSTALLLNPLTVTATTTLSKQDVLYETITTREIVPGLNYEEKSRLTSEGWIDIHVLKMDLTDSNLDLDILRSGEGWGTKDQLTDMADENSDVVGGINGSFFNMTKNPSDITGTEYENGNYASVANKYNISGGGVTSLIRTSENEMLFDFLGASLKIISDEGRELYISGINLVSDLTNPIVFNSNAYTDTSYIDSAADIYKIVIRQGIVVEVVPPKEVVDIPGDGYIISIPESIAQYHISYFKAGTFVNLSVTDNPYNDDLNLAISGSGRILENGKVVEPNKSVVEPNKRHPRSVIGITADKHYLIFMVVDGRGTSIGATHNELANYLLEYNVSDAMHFDGGGSSELIARNLGDTATSVVNQPSDGSERKIVNGLGIVSTAPQGELTTLIIKPSSQKTYINMPITFGISGYDQYGNPVEIDMSNVIMMNVGITGKWDGNIFIPNSAGTGKITCLYSGVVASVNITSIDSYIDLNIEPSVLTVEPGKSGQFKLIATDQVGFQGQIDSSSVTWEVTDPEMGDFVDGVFVAKSKTGITKIVAKGSGRAVSAFIVVGNEKSLLNSFENTSVTTLNYPTTVVGNVGISKDHVFDGNQSIQIRYNFPISDETQATYAVLDNVIIEKRIKSLGLEVLGDDNHTMIKGRLVDASGATFNITFTSNVDFTGWKYLEADLPDGVVYPANLDRIYAVTLATYTQRVGTLYFDQLMQNKYIDTSNLKFDVEPLMSDPLLANEPENGDFVISLFGATSGRNRLLDNVIMKRIYDRMEGSDLAIFAGSSDVSKSMVTSPLILWNDKFTVNDYKDVRVITLATNEGGLVKSDPNQWKMIDSTLANTVQNNIIFVGNLNPEKENDFTDQREGDLLHSVLSSYQQKTNKNIFYINASGYKFELELKDGIHYIDLNGLWYDVTDDNKVDLLNTFNMLQFYIKDDTLHYAVKNLYPPIEISQ